MPALDSGDETKERTKRKGERNDWRNLTAYDPGGSCQSWILELVRWRNGKNSNLVSSDEG
nr:hypothetical protein [Bacteroidota bacterium]